MSTFYLPGDAPTTWQNHDAGTLNDPSSTFLTITDYEAGRRDGIMIGLILGAVSGSIIMTLIGLIIL